MSAPNPPPPSITAPVAPKAELQPVVIASPSKPLPSPSKVVFPPLPPSTLVGNWILTCHSFAPQRDYFMRFCSGLAKRRVVDHLLNFRIPQTSLSSSFSVAVHHSRLVWIGGPLAELLLPPRPADDAIATAKDPQPDFTTPDANPTGSDGACFSTPTKQSTRDDTVTAKVDNATNNDVDKAQIVVDDHPGGAGTTIAPDTDTDIDKNIVQLASSPDVPTKDSVDVSGKMMDAEPSSDDSVYVRDSAVELCNGEAPRTFAIIVKFLYCEEICFNYLTFDEIVALATSAHRWELTDLYNATFAYVMDQNLLDGGLGIRTFLPLVSHAETPESFRRYFCIAVGHHFDVLYPRLKAYAKTETNVRPVKDIRPPLWGVVIRQKMLAHVVHCIRMYSLASYDIYLLDVMLGYYEACEEVEEEEMMNLLSQLNWDHIDLNMVLQPDGICKRWTPRGVRLLALASISPQCESLEVRIPWNIPLQRLLKTEVWSFQTEHVSCGPYICYLHVRKNIGPEVSLFVHIWNRDGKPIADEARHERVRVTCRATESYCGCDSGKQWSDSSHGFLENLKFEGGLSRYPGLGWSQFLEARRIEEWRHSHGEDCGLAITAVLQFLKPRKQFEGPARRSGGRPSSPTKLSSPIQKKRSGLKMKLRESR